MTTNEVAKITGLTLRQLQWLDERKILQPSKKQAWRRSYESIDLLRLNIVQDLRRKGLSLNAVAKRLPAINRALDSKCIGRFLIVSTRHEVAKTMDDMPKILALLDGAPEALAVIDLSHHGEAR